MQYSGSQSDLSEAVLAHMQSCRFALLCLHVADQMQVGQNRITCSHVGCEILDDNYTAIKHDLAGVGPYAVVSLHFIMHCVCCRWKMGWPVLNLHNTKSCCLSRPYSIKCELATMIPSQPCRFDLFCNMSIVIKSVWGVCSRVATSHRLIRW